MNKKALRGKDKLTKVGPLLGTNKQKLPTKKFVGCSVEKIEAALLEAFKEFEGED
jgi:hypothetical protein